MMAPSIEDFLARGILLDPEVASQPALLPVAVALLHEEPDRLVIDLEAINEYLARHPGDAAHESAGSMVQVTTTKPPTSPSSAVLPRGPERASSTPLVSVHLCYTTPSHKRTVDDFVALYNRRFAMLEALLRTRSELAGLVSINRLKSKPERERGAIIGMLLDKSVTAKKHLLLTLEDPTGTVKALATANRADAYIAAQDLAFDEVVGLSGTWARGLFFVDAIIVPDIPASRELRKGPIEEYVAFVGDVHVGAKTFLSEEFEHMLLWLQGRSGSPDSRALARKVHYVCFMGDLVEGVGIYPGQEHDLTIPDIREQYRTFAAYVDRIPHDKAVIIIPGNHDVGRISEPQPPLDKEYAPDLWSLPHVRLLSNPCLFTIGACPGFSGLDVLLYHGYSLIYYANAIDSIRSKGGMTRVDLVMEYLLRHRHLAPSHGSNLYVPDATTDPLVIDRIPDLFVTGHIHRTSVRTYRGTTLINASAWMDESDYQEKQGLIPQPARLPIVNLQTRQVRILNFFREHDEA